MRPHSNEGPRQTRVHLDSPFLRQPFRLGDLRRSHFGCHFFAKFHRNGERWRARHGQVEPHAGDHGVSGHTVAVFIHQAKVSLRQGVPMVCRLAIPLGCLRRVLRHAMAAPEIYRCEPILRRGVSGIGQRTQEPHCISVVVFKVCSLAVLELPGLGKCERTDREKSTCQDRSSVPPHEVPTAQPSTTKAELPPAWIARIAKAHLNLRKRPGFGPLGSL